MTLAPGTERWIFERPSAGVVVAFGVGASRFVRSRSHAMMILPDNISARTYRWPSNGQAALIHECGSPDDARLDSLVHELMRAGAPSVVAIRHALLPKDPAVFFSQEIADVAA